MTGYDNLFLIWVQIKNLGALLFPFEAVCCNE
jgi:hypothetical protein